jgi:hypothetical protein
VVKQVGAKSDVRQKSLNCCIETVHFASPLRFIAIKMPD